MREESIIQKKSFEFSVKLVKYLLSIDRNLFSPIYKQLLRSGTSVWANIQEASSGQSTNDFIAKQSIALKEIQETKYWLRLVIEVWIWEISNWKELLSDAEELSKILTSIIVTMKSKQKL